MRRWHSSAHGARGALVTVALAMLAGVGPLRAQGGLSTEGAIFLLVPVGARTVASGQTIATAENGSESIFGNPAGVARMTHPEAALHYGKFVAANNMVLALVYPAGKAGVLAFGAQLNDYGAQDFTDPAQGTLGQLLPRDITFSVTYAATLGTSLRAGVTYKVLQSRLDCTGPCGAISTYSASTNGLDAGVQYQVHRADSLTFGIALRNLGLKLQVNDNPQSDPLPSRIHIGVQGMVPRIAEALKGADLRWAAEIVNRTSFKQPSLRVGGELGLQKQLYLRAGYASGTGDGSGPAIGLGFVRGRLGVDFARLFGGLSSDVGTPPTFLSLRLSF